MLQTDEKIGYESNSDKCLRLAEEEGLVVIEPDEYTLLLDIDLPFNGPEVSTDFTEKYQLFSKIFPVESIGYNKSRSGNTHVSIRMRDKVTPVERILLQAALGSDGKREILSFKRLKEGDPKPTLFLERAIGLTTA